MAVVFNDVFFCEWMQENGDTLKKMGNFTGNFFDYVFIMNQFDKLQGYLTAPTTVNFAVLLWAANMFCET